MDPVPLRAKAKVFPLVCKAYIRWLLDFLDLSSSYPPLSLCSSPTDLFAVPTPCQERLHFRHLDLAVFTLKMLFSLITIWLTPSSLCSKVPFKMRPILIILLKLQLSPCQLSQVPLLCSLFFFLIRSTNHVPTLYIIHLMCIVCSLTHHTHTGI